MAANPIICYRVHTYGELLQVRKLHSHMEPIQRVLSLWRNLPVNGPQPRVAVGKDRDRRGFIHSVFPQMEADRADGFGAAVADEGKASGTPIAIQHLASNNLEVLLRSLMSISNVPTIQTDKPTTNSLLDLFDEEDARASADF
jgi:hypothetical protein